MLLERWELLSPKHISHLDYFYLCVLTAGKGIGNVYKL